jgi:hypothetical protein
MRRVAISGIAVAMLFLAAGRVSQAAALLSVVPGSDYLTTLQSARGKPAFLGSVTRGALIVTGPLGTQAADSHTGKTPNQMDFFPFGAFQEAHPNGAVQEASGTTPTPEPATSLLIGVGLLGLAAIWKRKRR